jgi:hypothetical protein
VRGRLYARVVMQRDAPRCTIEAQLQERGAQVTRLLACELLPQPSLAVPTFRVLGKLYDGLIVPHADSFDAGDIAVVAGVPVVFEDQDLPALGL